MTLAELLTRLQNKHHNKTKKVDASMSYFGLEGLLNLLLVQRDLLLVLTPQVLVTSHKPRQTISRLLGAFTARCLPRAAY